MSAKDIYDLAPLGSIIRYSDGTPRPPERFKKKLAAWENTNNGGRFVRKTAERTLGNHTTPASFTLHQGDFGSAGVVVLTVFKTFSIASPHTFLVVEPPKPGSIRIFDRQGDEAELVHLADHRAAAEAWLASHRHPNAVLERGHGRRVLQHRGREGGMTTAPSLPPHDLPAAAAAVLFARTTKEFSSRSSATTPSQCCRDRVGPPQLRARPRLRLGCRLSHPIGPASRHDRMRRDARRRPPRTRTTTLPRPPDEYSVGRFGFVINVTRHRLDSGPSSFAGWR
jgi:hypothetical protein